MNENVDYFKDQKEQLTKAVETAIMQVQIMQDVLPSNALNKLLSQLGIIKSLYVPNFKQLVISQCVENGKLPEQQFYLNLGGGTVFKITVEAEKMEPPANAKNKWYQF